MKTRRSSAWGTGVAVVIAIVLVIWLGFFPPWGDREADEIRIGVLTPLTGEGATYGEATKTALDLAVEETNRGGGINGRQVRLIYEDTRLSPEVATSAIQKLVDVDGVPVIIGAFGSSITLAVSPIAERKRVVLFSASSTADTIKDAGDYVFRNVPPNDGQGSTAAEFAWDTLKARTAAILKMNNDYGISLTEAFVSRYGELGGAILVDEGYNQGDRDFRTQLAKIAAESPDIVFYPGHYQESGLILRQARELGIDAAFVGGDGSYSPELISIAGDAAEGSYYTLMGVGGAEFSEAIDAFEAAYRAKYGEDPGVYSAYAYDALFCIADAIERGGDTADGIKQALYDTDGLAGVTGTTRFDEYGEVDKPYSIYEIESGAFVLLGG
jgi:branched-chain amino acid transport system substrate-binding protein